MQSAARLIIGIFAPFCIFVSALCAQTLPTIFVASPTTVVPTDPITLVYSHDIVPGAHYCVVLVKVPGQNTGLSVELVPELVDFKSLEQDMTYNRVAGNWKLKAPELYTPLRFELHGPFDSPPTKADYPFKGAARIPIAKSATINYSQITASLTLPSGIVYAGDSIQVSYDGLPPISPTSTSVVVTKYVPPPSPPIKIAGQVSPIAQAQYDADMAVYKAGGFNGYVDLGTIPAPGRPGGRVDFKLPPTSGEYIFTLTYSCGRRNETLAKRVIKAAARTTPPSTTTGNSTPPSSSDNSTAVQETQTSPGSPGPRPGLPPAPATKPASSSIQGDRPLLADNRSFEGTWDTSEGILVIQVQGTRATAIVDGDKDRRLEGIIDGRVFEGIWTEKDSNYGFILTLNARGTGFTGAWGETSLDSTAWESRVRGKRL